jgi:hypothetical protein
MDTHARTHAPSTIPAGTGVTLVQGSFFAVASFVLFWFLLGALLIALTGGFWWVAVCAGVLDVCLFAQARDPSHPSHPSHPSPSPSPPNLHPTTIGGTRFSAAYFTYKVAKKVQT